MEGGQMKLFKKKEKEYGWGDLNMLYEFATSGLCKVCHNPHRQWAIKKMLEILIKELE